MRPSTVPEPAARPPDEAACAAPRRSRLKHFGAWARRALGLGILAFLGGFAVFVAGLDRSERQPGTVADGIVALTGGAGRIGDAIDLLARGFAGRLLITGVNERTSRDEIARLNPHQRRLVECCVDLDYRARDTVGNAVETAEWARRNGFDTLIVVTSNYHMPRSLIEIGRAMPEARATPFAVVPSSAEGEGSWTGGIAAHRLLAEYAKYLAASARSFLPSAPGLAATARSTRRSAALASGRLAESAPAR